jgi:hypothetical protein
LEVIVTVKLSAQKHSVHLVLNPKVTPDQLNKVLAQTAGIAGCTGCGFLGMRTRRVTPSWRRGWR